MDRKCAGFSPLEPYRIFDPPFCLLSVIVHLSAFEWPFQLVSPLGPPLFEPTLFLFFCLALGITDEPKTQEISAAAAYAK